ncbi:MAG: winged helix-turn-helix domain-containing protein [Desulfovibrionaceae bacterium]|nr:winged helix-turn-helix domain-containing protein [Desulfovibrionaceae bacterium]
MAKSAKNTKKGRKYLAEQDMIAAMQIKEVLTFFHDKVLHGFISMTMLRSLLLIILFLLGHSVPRAATLAGFCSATARKKKAFFENGQIKAIFTRKPGSGRKSACSSKQDEIIENLESHDYRIVKQIQSMIQEKISASVSLSAVKVYLHKLGYKWIKSGSLPAKADPEAQCTFYEDVEKDLMERARDWDELQPILQEACEHFKGEHYEEIKRILLQWCKLVAMPRYEFDQKEIPDVATLEELSQMSYQYADEEERAYHTQWKRDLEAQWKKDFETNAYNNGEKDARMSIAKTLASMGMDTDKIAKATGLSGTDVRTALQVNSQP